LVSFTQDDGELEYSASASGSGSGSANKVDSPILGLVIEPNSSKRSKQAQNNQKTDQDSDAH
jgi:hypothetical protein